MTLQQFLRLLLAFHHGSSQDGGSTRCVPLIFAVSPFFESLYYYLEKTELLVSQLGAKFTSARIALWGGASV